MTLKQEYMTKRTGAIQYFKLRAIGRIIIINYFVF